MPLRNTLTVSFSRSAAPWSVKHRPLIVAHQADGKDRQQGSWQLLTETAYFTPLLAGWVVRLIIWSALH